jgi:SpoIID/LytB domain protein
MSQYGAQAMAVAGKSFAQILSHYYRNTQLQTMDGL